jgi:hypothetical protein
MFAGEEHDGDVTCDIHDSTLVEHEDVEFDMRGKSSDPEFETNIAGGVWEMGCGSLYQCPKCIAYLYYNENPGNPWGESLESMANGLVAYCFERWAAGELWQDVQGEPFVEVEQ